MVYLAQFQFSLKWRVGWFLILYYQPISRYWRGGKYAQVGIVKVVE
ncbi:hypothetical protein EVA_18956 [gut metagenome]|uniref:Uncharacterized protein n=1 Tax=gut metagenome TaxID=749906 RepID=J9FTP6_9ZZZZ